MARAGDIVEIAFQKATPEEIRLRPNTYQLEPDVGEVVGDKFIDSYGQQYNMVRVRGRLRRVLTRKLKIVRSMGSAPDGETEGDATPPSDARYFGETA